MLPTLPSVSRPDGEILHEVTRSICPECRTVIDAQVLLRDEQVFMRKRCPEHGWFEGLIYADAKAYVSQARYNKPGQAPLRISTESARGCPLDCGLCPEHRQHTCLALIEVNSACNLDCPVCFANAGAGFNLTIAEVETMLDRFVELEGHPEVVQFSGGEPTIHPNLIAMIDAARARDIGYTMVNTNGLRVAEGGPWFEECAARRPLIYLQFDGLSDDTYRTIRGDPRSAHDPRSGRHPDVHPGRSASHQRRGRAGPADDPGGVLAAILRAQPGAQADRAGAGPRRLPSLLQRGTCPHRSADPGSHPPGGSCRSAQDEAEMIEMRRYISGAVHPKGPPSAFEARPRRSRPAAPW